MPGRLAVDTIKCVQIPWLAQSVGNQPSACLCALTHCWPCRELVHLHTAGLQGNWVLSTACRKFVSSHPAGRNIMHLCTAGLQGSCLGGSGGGQPPGAGCACEERGIAGQRVTRAWHTPAARAHPRPRWPAAGRLPCTGEPPRSSRATHCTTRRLTVQQTQQAGSRRGALVQLLPARGASCRAPQRRRSQRRVPRAATGGTRPCTFAAGTALSTGSGCA